MTTYTVSTNTFTMPSSVPTTPYIVTYPSPNTTTSPGYTYNTIDQMTPSNLQVNGTANFEGDVKIKGKSLLKLLEKFEERLAILHPNNELESRWEELRKLRLQYMELEAELLEKEKMWAILKK